MKQTLGIVQGIDSVEVLAAHASSWIVRVRLQGNAGGDVASLLRASNIRVRWVDVVPSDLVVLAVERDDEQPDSVIIRIASDVPRTQAARMELELTALPGLLGDQGRIQFAVRTAPSTDEASEDCERGAVPLIEIDYLAKDYTSFRQTFFDVLSQRVPAWTERHAADELVATAEVLAYSADYLSAYQDAVAMEAYLTTARLRTSVRRHARFLDYRLLEGCASRVLLAFEVNRDDPVDIAAGMHVTGTVDDPSYPGPYISARFVPPNAQIFETLESARLYFALNRIEIQADADRAIQVLPAGSTRAILRGTFPMLRSGMLLILEQDAGGHRHAVRLSRDPLLVAIGANETGTLITWYDADATPCDLIVAARDGNGRQRSDITVVCGNVVPAQQGTPVTDEFFTFLPETTPNPPLQAGNLLCAVPYDAEAAHALPATALFELDPAQALPQIVLHGRERGSGYDDIWQARNDLLDSSAFARHFVAEIENDRTVKIRFGDDVHGRRPVSGTQFHPEYRIGAGVGPDVGADVLGSIILDDTTGLDERITRVSNPLPARGGVLPEDLESARRDAPAAFRLQQRCVIPEDFVAAVRSDPRVADAITARWWSGSRVVTFVYVQACERTENMDGLLAQLTRSLLLLTVAGEVPALRAPTYVPIFLRMLITTDPSRAKGSVVKAVTAALERFIADSHFTFGQSVYASPLIAVAMGVSGVQDANVANLVRYGAQEYTTSSDAVEIKPHEIVRLDNDRLQPEHGQIVIDTATYG
jgi:hypothetical protein